MRVWRGHAQDGGAVWNQSASFAAPALSIYHEIVGAFHSRACERDRKESPLMLEIQSRFLPPAVAAKILGISKTTIYKGWKENSDKVPPYVETASGRKVYVGDLEDFINNMIRKGVKPS